MKSFKAVSVLKCPRESLWCTMRDELSDLVPKVDDVESVTLVERTETDASVAIVNRWVVRNILPAALRRSLDIEELGWIDRNVWQDESWRCEWTIETLFWTDHIECHGTTTYEPAMGGRGTRVTMEGSLDVDQRALDALGRALRGPVTSLIESVATTMVPKNTRRLLEVAAERASIRR